MLYWYGGVTLVCRLPFPLCCAPPYLSSTARRRKCFVLFFSPSAEPCCLICCCLLLQGPQSLRRVWKARAPTAPASLSSVPPAAFTWRMNTSTPDSDPSISLSLSILESFMLCKDRPDPLSDFKLPLWVKEGPPHVIDIEKAIRLWFFTLWLIFFFFFLKTNIVSDTFLSS